MGVVQGQSNLDQRWKEAVRQIHHGAVSSKLPKNFGPWFTVCGMKQGNYVKGTEFALRPPNSFTTPFSVISSYANPGLDYVPYIVEKCFFSLDFFLLMLSVNSM